MPPPATRPLPPAALRLLAVTAEAWAVRLCSPLPAPRRHAAQTTPAELRQWPYWPDYPGAAIGWR